MLAKTTTNKVTRSFTFLFVFVFLFTSVFGNNLVVKAADATTDSTESNTETDSSTDESTTTDEVEKKLVQCDDNWTIFQYDDENGDPTQFDVLYQGKTPEELEAEGVKIQFRQIYRSTLKTSPYYWIDLGDPVPNEHKKWFLNSVMEFRAITLDELSVLSLSDNFALYDAQIPFIMSSTPCYYEEYDLVEKTGTFTMTLKYNQHLTMDSDAYIYITHDRDDFEFSGYTASNLKVENKISTHIIEDKEYTIDFSIVTFDVELPSLILIEDSTKAPDEYHSRIFYTFNIVGLKSCANQNQVEGFILDSWTTRRYINSESPSTDNIYVEFVEISGTASTIVAEESTQLIATVYPSNATVQTVTWVSDDEDYAVVDESGLVTAKSAGIGQTVTIYACAEDGSKVYASYTLSITGPSQPTEPSVPVEPSNPTTPSEPVTPSQPSEPSVPVTPSEPSVPVDTDVKVSTVKITGSATAVKAGKKLTLKAVVTPTEATNTSVTWSSSNTKYATVNSKGVVTTKKAGLGKTVKITATANDGSGVKATYKIKIVKATVTKIKITASSKTVKAGGKVTLKATVKPTNVTTKKVTWSSSNKKYATVNKKGVVTTKKAGAGKTVTITAKAKDGSGKKATFKIKIK